MSEVEIVIRPLDQVLAEHIHAVLVRYNGLIKPAAKAMKMHEKTLYRKMEHYGITCGSLTQHREVFWDGYNGKKQTA